MRHLLFPLILKFSYFIHVLILSQNQFREFRINRILRDETQHLRTLTKKEISDRIIFMSLRTICKERFLKFIDCRLSINDTCIKISIKITSNNILLVFWFSSHSRAFIHLQMCLLNFFLCRSSSHYYI